MIRLGPAATVKAVLEAELEVAKSWPAALHRAVQAEIPVCLGDEKPIVWAVTVQAFRNPGETPLAAAQRLALYLDLQAETHGRPPRLSAVQVEAISRREA